jgi:hypothetical protein
VCAAGFDRLAVKRGVYGLGAAIPFKGHPPMHAYPNPSQMPSAVDLIETWLDGQMIGRTTPWLASQPSRDGLPRLPRQTGAERLASIREVLDRRPSIAQFARRLSVHDQFELTIQLLTGTHVLTRDLAARSVTPGRSMQVAGRGAVDPAQRTGFCLQVRGRRGRPRSSR